MIRWLPLLAAAALLAAGCAQQVVRPTVDPFLGDIPKDAPKNPDNEFVGRPADPPVGTPAGTAEITAGPAGVSIGSPRSVEPKPKEKEPDSTSGLAPAPPPGTGAPLEQVSAPAPAPPPEAPAPTYESLQKALQARGVSWQQLQCMGSDSWHFICAIPDPNTPGVRENFEVTRPGNFGLNAIQAVVEQIDKERSAPSPQTFER